MEQLQIVGVNQLALKRVEPPPCAAEDVIVEVAACGICGSDLGYLASGGLGGPAPMALGHEFAGRIIEVGSRVRQWTLGQTVVVNPLSAANMIGNGGPEGAFAARVRVRAADQPDTLYALPAGLNPEQGALAEPLAVAFHALQAAGFRTQMRVLVLGAGPIGLASVIALRWLGAADVVVVERSQARRALASQLGADMVLASLDEAGWQQLRERHGQTLFYGMALPQTELYVDCAGAAGLLEAVVAQAAPRSTLAVVAVHGQRLQLDLAQLMAKELVLRGALGYGDSFPQALACLAECGDRLQSLVSHRLPLREYAAGFALAADPEQGAKVLLLPT